jgi:transcriptional regulator with XRE-family HTH domain
MNLIASIITLLLANLLELAKVICMITARQIRAARALLGWTQQDLADKAIVAINAIARIERGSSDPRASTTNAIEAALSITVAYLL